jgi:hypothetical protein
VRAAAKVWGSREARRLGGLRVGVSSGRGHSRCVLQVGGEFPNPLSRQFSHRREFIFGCMAQAIGVLAPMSPFEQWFLICQPAERAPL